MDVGVGVLLGDGVGATGVSAALVTVDIPFSKPGFEDVTVTVAL